MRDIRELAEEMGIEYTINENPSPEKIAQLKKSIERREKYTKELQECFEKGGLDEVKRYLKINEK